jgi:hypothetical protein
MSNGLRHVVVGTRIQAAHHVGDGLPRGEHEDRHPPRSPAKLAADIETVDIRQPDVQDDRIEVALAGHPDSIVAAGLDIDRVSILAERPLQHSRHPRGILDD